MNDETEKKVVRDTTSEAIRLAKTLLHTARHGALAVNDQATGHPNVSRIQLSTDYDGSLTTLVSSLSPHTQAMVDNPKCALLVGEAGKGDPLAHPRMTITLKAQKIEHNTDDHMRLRQRHLMRHPKAALYVDFGDFSFFKLTPLSAALNGGFGKAFNLTQNDLALKGDTNGLSEMEQSAVAHMNEDHLEAIGHYATELAGQKSGAWKIATLDSEGMDLVLGDQCARVFYPSPLSSSSELRNVLKHMADEARQIRAEKS